MRHRRSVGTQVDRDNWQQVRDLFDAVCELDPSQWRSELARLSADPVIIAETLELLEAQTCELGRARAPLERMMGAAIESELAEGDRIGPWRLHERLASGGMGIVFRAERDDGLYAQAVAIKFLQGAPGPRVAERLAAERRILASLQHPGIARLYDGGSTPAGQPYLVMEYIEGQPLDAHCATHGLGLQQRLELFLRVCAGVQAAHARMVLHCDIKPSNILVRANGEPVLLDFGVSRLLEDETGAGAASFFTPAYAPPELQAGQVVGIAGDVFSLGVVLGELLAGDGGRRGAADAGTAARPPSTLAGDDCGWKRQLGGDLDAIVMQAGAMEPERRYASVEALAADVKRWLSHRPVAARNGGRLYRAGRWLQRNWKGVAVLLAVLLLAAWFVWRLDQARHQAQQEAQVAREVSEFLVSAFNAANPRKGELRGSSEVSARDVLEASQKRIDTQHWTSPLVKARLQSVLAQAYQNIGLDQPAEAMYRAAIPVLVAAGEDSRDIAVVSLNELSTLLANGGRGEESERFARQSLALLDPKRDRLRTAQAWNSLGLALNASRRFDESVQAFDQALALHRANGSSALGVATVLQNKALMYIEKGDYAPAEQLLHQSAQLRRPWGTRTSEWWSGRYALMRVTTSQGRYQQALAISEEVLELGRHLYGESSANLGSIHNERGGLLQDLGRYAEGAAEYSLALEQYARLSERPEMDSAITLNNLAGLEESRGDLEKAQTLYQRSLQIRRQLLGEDAPQVWVVEANLARMLIHDGKPVPAQPLIAHAREGWARKVAADNPRRLLAEAVWAEGLLAKGDLTAADQSLATIKQHMGDDVRVQRRYLVVLAQRQRLGGDLQGALQSRKQLVELYVQQVGADSVETARQRGRYAATLAAAGQCAQAREQARAAQPLLERQLLPASTLRSYVAALVAAPDCRVAAGDARLE